MRRSLRVQNLNVTRDGREVVRGASFELPAGQAHVILGPNGSGKSSLANALMGHPSYRAKGRARLDGRDLLRLTPDRRSRLGLFLSPQYPPEVSGVTLAAFLRHAVNARRRRPYGAMEFHELLQGKLAELEMDPALAQRGLNEGFSGGEKKRAEALQLLLLEPKYAILDETDSGLDVDALKTVAQSVRRQQRAGTGILVITHYARLLKYLKPTRVHVMIGGRLVAAGGPALARRVERSGFGSFRRAAQKHDSQGKGHR